MRGIGYPDKHHQCRDQETLDPSAGISARGCDRITGQENRAKGEASEQQMPVSRHRAGARTRAQQIE